MQMYYLPSSISVQLAIFPLWSGQHAAVGTNWSLAEQFPSIGGKVRKGILVISSEIGKKWLEALQGKDFEPF